MMFYRLQKDTYFKKYGSFGYITSTKLFNDRVVDESGACFLATLTDEPQDLNEIAQKIAEQFIDADIETVRQDALEFFAPFVEDGFIACGTTAVEANGNTVGFSYDDLEPSTIKTDHSPLKSRIEDDTQSTLDEYFRDHPQIVSFQIELTSRCNERCLHCYIPHECKDGSITSELFYSTLDQLKELGCWHLTLSGGEPMLHRNFKQFLKTAKEQGFYVTVLTNLTLLDDEIVEIMGEGNKTSVQVSLYSMNPDHHDETTQLPGSHAKTIAAIEKLHANNIPMQISCPTMKENKNDFGDVMRWAHDHKIRAVTDYMIMAEYNHNTSNLSHRLTPKECGEVIRDILNEDADYAGRVLSPDFATQAERYANDLDAALCGVGISSCCMVSNGNIYPCAGWQDYICGNLNEQSLDYIWNDSPKMNELRSLRRRDMETCIDCDKQAFCSPCMVRNANESPTGDPFEVSPYFCEVAAVNKELVLDWREKQLARTS